MCLSRAPPFPEVSREQVCKRTRFADGKNVQAGQLVHVRGAGTHQSQGCGSEIRMQPDTKSLSWLLAPSGPWSTCPSC